MPALDYSFVSGGRALRLDADLTAGWETRPNTNSYAGQCVFDFPIPHREGRFDANTRAQVQLFCRDNPRLERPLVTFCEDYTREGINVTGESNRLRIDAVLLAKDNTLDERLPWGRTEDRNKPYLHWQFDLVGVEWLPTNVPFKRWYELQVLIVFSPPRNRPAPVEWDRGTGFFSGGLPTLGRRR